MPWQDLEIGILELFAEECPRRQSTRDEDGWLLLDEQMRMPDDDGRRWFESSHKQCARRPLCRRRFESTNPNKRYCSERCERLASDARRDKRRELACAECGTLFVVRPSHGGRGGWKARRFCSIRCKNRSADRVRSEKRKARRALDKAVAA